MVKKDVGASGSNVSREGAGAVSPQKKPNVWKQYIWPVIKRIFRIVKLLVSAFLLVCLIDFLAYAAVGHTLILSGLFYGKCVAFLMGIVAWIMSVLVRLGILEWSDVAEFIWRWGTTGP